MIVYLVRHAEAEERSSERPDEWRHLTAKGRTVAGKVARKISGLGRKPRRIVTSPLTRAVQTAELCAAAACRRHTVEASTVLMPGVDAADVVAFLRAMEDKRVMLVGHEPQLGMVARLLLQTTAPLELKKGACLALKCATGTKPAEFLWYLAPGKNALFSLKKAFRIP